ncbi:MAG: dTDP-4-dehydrorhamnose reductase [Rhodobacteraceae bacterium]|nr:dTDP-4-dehydrorhamnose reductase [Paracoccaceae bacterium]
MVLWGAASRHFKGGAAIALTVLVFGKDGQLGQALACAAAKRSHPVNLILLDRSDADLMTPAICADIIANTAADVVVNAAAMTAVGLAESQAVTAMAVNGTAPGIMAAAAAKRGLPFIQISTDYVFGGAGEHRWRPDDPTEPETVYGQSKLIGEQGVVAAFGDSDVPYVVLRTSWVISAWGKTFVSAMLDAGRTREQVSVVADQIGGPTPADDLARAVLQIADHLANGSAPGGIYHYSGAPDVSWADLARAVFAAARQRILVEDITTQEFADPVPRPLNSRLDCTTTQSVFGITRPDWAAALPGIVAALQDRAELAKTAAETA